MEQVLGFSMRRTAVALFVASTLGAQTTGDLEGWARDTAGEPLPGVAVTVTSPSLQGERRTVTERDGRFRILTLPPGDYRLLADLAGYNTVEVPGFRVGLDRTVTLELTMTAAFAEEITIQDEPPVVDLTSTTTGQNFSETLFQDLPLTRTSLGLALAAAGVVDGGSGSGGPRFGDPPSIGGASLAENRYLVDGLDVTEPEHGIEGVELPFEFIAEIEVKTGGYEAEYGGALGGVLNLLTKSGGNELHGNVFGYYTDDELQGTAPASEVSQGVGFVRYDYGATLGGKLVRDRLWYFAAANPRVEGDDQLTRQQLPVTSTIETLRYSGKLTWQARPGQQVVLSASGDPSDGTDVLLQPNAAGLLLADGELDGRSLGLTYHGAFGSRLAVEAQAGRVDVDFVAGGVRDVPVYIDRAGGTFAAAQGCGDPELVLEDDVAFAEGCRGGFGRIEEDQSRHEVRGALTWFRDAGGVDHEIKVGGLARRSDMLRRERNPSPAPGPLVDGLGQVVDPDGVTGQVWVLFADFAVLDEFILDDRGETDEQALFVQDALRIGGRWTLNLGLRIDALDATGDDTGKLPHRRLDFGFDEMVAPRVGLVWDPRGSGRSKLYAHYGRFYESVPLFLNIYGFGGFESNRYVFLYPEDGSLPTAENVGACVTVENQCLNVPFFQGSEGVAPGTDPTYTEETVGGFEVEIRPGLTAGLRATYRELEDAIEDYSVDGGQTFFLANLGRTYTVNPVTLLPLPSPVTVPEAVREYRAAALTVNRRWRDGWQLFGSYVWSQSEGNYGGLYRQDTGQLAPHWTSAFDVPGLIHNSFGLLPNDRTHQLKVGGSYAWPFELVTGFFGQYLSGTPISKYGCTPYFEACGLRFVTPRGSEGRTPDIWSLDLHLEYPVELPKEGWSLALIADVFNAADNDRATAVDELWNRNFIDQTTDPNECGGDDATCVDADGNPLGNASYGEPIAFQQPRTVQLGLKLRW